MAKLEKIQCEICGSQDKSILHRHHITPRTDPNTSHEDMNLAVLCPNCHSKIHAGLIEIIGLFPSTKQPYNRVLVYKENGISNVPGLDEPYYKPKPAAMRWHDAEEEAEEADSR